MPIATPGRERTTAATIASGIGAVSAATCAVIAFRSSVGLALVMGLWCAAPFAYYIWHAARPTVAIRQRDVRSLVAVVSLALFGGSYAWALFSRDGQAALSFLWGPPWHWGAVAYGAAFERKFKRLAG